MPKSNLDWLGIASLWIGAAVMAIKAGGLPLMSGAPLWLAGSFWGYVPILLVTVYVVIAIWRQFVPVSTETKLSGAIPHTYRDADKTVALNEARANSQALQTIRLAMENARIAVSATSNRKRAAEKVLPEMKAALLTANKRFGIPINLPQPVDVSDELELARRLFERVRPLLKEGHIEEARAAAEEFIARFNRPNDESERA